MIEFGGSVQRSFYFPADLHTALAYYGDMDRTLHFLPHIAVLQKFASNQYRLLYHTTEAGIYQVRMICDLEAQVQPANKRLLMRPLEQAHNEHQAVRFDAGLYSMSGQGFYNSESVFSSEGDGTRIEYSLSLSAVLPVPISIRLMPGEVRNAIAANITSWRIDEIADGFIRRSIAGFQRRHTNGPSRYTPSHPA